MGCFCKDIVSALQADAEADVASSTDDATTDPTQTADAADKIVPAVGHWLAARWLPAPPFEPDPDWQETAEDLPEPPMSPAALAVISQLIQAQQACKTGMGLDPAQPDQAAKLARVLRTFNRRLPQLPPLDPAKTQEWQALAALNDQADQVRTAVAQGLFNDEDPPPDPPLTPWRPLLSKLKALAPLIAVGQTADIDFSQPEAVSALADKIRKLRAVALPPLDNPMQVMQLIARTSAVARLQKSLGADPRQHPFERVRAAVQRKAAAAAALIPETVTVENGQLSGMPPRQPNPSQLINQDTITAAQRLRPETLDQMKWTTPAADQMDLLSTGAPVATLVTLLQALGINPVRGSPCGSSCDAGALQTR
jgi:hypothetical protein